MHTLGNHHIGFTLISFSQEDITANNKPGPGRLAELKPRRSGSPKDLKTLAGWQGDSSSTPDEKP